MDIGLDASETISTSQLSVLLDSASTTMDTALTNHAMTFTHHANFLGKKMNSVLDIELASSAALAKPTTHFHLQLHGVSLQIPAPQHIRSCLSVW